MYEPFIYSERPSVERGSAGGSSGQPVLFIALFRVQSVPAFLSVYKALFVPILPQWFRKQYGKGSLEI